MDQKLEYELLIRLRENTKQAMLELYCSGKSDALLPEYIRAEISDCRQRECTHKEVEASVNIGWQQARREHAAKNGGF